MPAGIAWTLQRVRATHWLSMDVGDQSTYDRLKKMTGLQQGVQAMIKASKCFPNLKIMVSTSPRATLTRHTIYTPVMQNLRPALLNIALKQVQ